MRKMPKIEKHTEGPVRVLVISNERKRNAFEGTMASDFLAYLDEAEDDPDIRAVVVTGAGDIAFSSGHDLKEVSSGAHAAAGVGEAPFLRPLELRTPVIAAVNGHCYAAALILALSCDLIVAGTNATFGSPGARLGMLPEGGQIGRLPRLMSHGRAVELMFTAEPMSASDAFRTGFVTRLVEPADVLPEAVGLARAIARNSPSVVAAIKVGVLLAERDGIEAAARYEAEVARGLEVRPDAREGVAAFFEKRAPYFEARLPQKPPVRPS
jgi:enoyl-CoA hydratase/carnithine racemase